ncbi:TVP38/TMEM64 family protein [Rudanella lutea]|uniref:TVP38/TMEM64 family protein n=1 Tax=Rudanella lutea TaxID=451374 RepID=UPI00036A0293|nr:VTT domain-containing protein [Rudanella lutea]
MISNKLTLPAVVSALMTVAPLLTSSFITYQVLVNEPLLAALTAGQWAVVTVVCALASALALMPPTFLALVFGYFLGWNALIPLFALNMAAILFVNTAVHWLDGDRLRHHLEQNPKVHQILDRIGQRELRFIFFAKLSPVLPFAVTNLMFALSGARLYNVLLGGFLGMVPRTALAVWAGSQARELRALLTQPGGTANLGWTQGIVAVLLLVSVVGLWRVLKGK